MQRVAQLIRSYVHEGNYNLIQLQSQATSLEEVLSMLQGLLSVNAVIKSLSFCNYIFSDLYSLLQALLVKGNHHGNQ
jgi:hypothetical protein